MNPAGSRCHETMPWQEALATVLRHPESFRSAAAGDRQALRVNLCALGAHDALAHVAVLCSLDARMLTRYLEIVQGTHLRHAEALMPATITCLVALLGHDALRLALWERAPQPFTPASSMADTYLALTVDFVVALEDDAPVWLPELARYEALRGSVRLADHPAPEPLDAGRLRLAAGARDARYRVDVPRLLADPATVSPVPCSTRVVVWRDDDGRVESVVLGESAFQLLGRCRTAVSRTELFAGLSASRLDSARRMVAAGLRVGLIEEGPR